MYMRASAEESEMERSNLVVNQGIASARTARHSLAMTISFHFSVLASKREGK